MDAGEAKAAEAAELDDRVDTLGRGFLGLTVACARCHDHKFDPITTQDYYALAGVFKSSRYVETPLAPPDVVEKFNQGQEKIKQQEAKVKEFLKASRRRSWGRREEGRGQVAGRCERDAGRIASRSGAAQEVGAAESAVRPHSRRRSRREHARLSPRQSER